MDGPRTRGGPGTGRPDGAADHPAGAGGAVPGGIPLRPAYRGPYAATGIFVFLFLETRAGPGVEEEWEIRPVGEPRGQRRHPVSTAAAAAAPPAARGGSLTASASPRSTSRAGRPGRLGVAGRRRGWCARRRGGPAAGWTADRGRPICGICRRPCSGCAGSSTRPGRHPYAVAERLGADPLLAAPATERPGLRPPGAADPAELAVRTVPAGPPARWTERAPRRRSGLRVGGAGAEGAEWAPGAWRPWGGYALHHLWRAGPLPEGDMGGGAPADPAREAA